jgi:hypothetical protein
MTRCPMSESVNVVGVPATVVVPGTPLSLPTNQEQDSPLSRITDVFDRWEIFIVNLL